MRKAISALKSTLEEAGCSISSDVDDISASFDGAVEQAVVNLLSNAHGLGNRQGVITGGGRYHPFIQFFFRERQDLVDRTAKLEGRCSLQRIQLEPDFALDMLA